MCVCYLTAALIRPLWVRLIGPVIRDAALPPSPVRWITSRCHLLRFQDKWTEGESITPREREGERKRSRDRIPYRDTEEDAEVGRLGKKVGSGKKKSWTESETEGILQGIKRDLNRGRKRGRGGKNGSSGLLLGQLPSLPPVPLTGYVLGCGLFLCSAVSQLFVTVSDLMLCWINHAGALWVVCAIYMCPCVSEHETVFVCINTWIYVHGGTKPQKEAPSSQQEAILNMLCSYLRREKKCVWTRTGALKLTLFFVLLYFPVVAIITQPLDSPLLMLIWPSIN